MKMIAVIASFTSLLLSSILIFFWIAILKRGDVQDAFGRYFGTFYWSAQLLIGFYLFLYVLRTPQ